MMAYREDIESVYSENIPWDKLSGTNIFVVGATGLIGSCIVEILMRNPHKDYKVFAGGRDENRAKDLFHDFWNTESFVFLRGDISSGLNWDVNFDYIIDAASSASPNFFASHPVEVILSNVLGVANLIRYGLSHGMKRFLYISSGEVYGQGDGCVFTENYSGYVDCTSPRSCYPSSKRAAETLCVSYAAEYGADVVIARPCHTYGPNFTENDTRAYAQFIRNALNREEIIMKSTGTQFRSWCYVVDCASALLYILLKGENCQAYNIADESSNITIKQFAETVAEIEGTKIQIECPTEAEIKGYNTVSKSIFSTEKISKLGWRPLPGNIKEKITKTISHIKDNK